MTNKTIQRLTFFGAIAIIGIIASQIYWVMGAWNNQERQFDQKVTVALLKVAHDLEEVGNGLLPDENLINKLASNYYVVNINGIINASNLDFFLKKEFEAIALNEDFEYGIYDCHTNKMMYGDYVSYSPDDAEISRKELQTYNEFTYYFGVRFPKHTANLLSSIRLAIIFSVILLITILFFLYALFIILKQKRLSELQKDFINNMTHEFKTPISTIKISADVLLNNPLIKADKRLLQYTNIIKEQNQRLNHQVEKVLQLAKIERNNLELSLETVNLHELIDQIRPSLDLKVTERKGILHIIENAENPNVKADRLHLTNIIHNLLDNAVKYCIEKPEVTISTKSVNQKTILCVTDNGIGINKEHHKKVFDKFYRVPTGNVHNVKGFGLGLFYIKNICIEHGWKVNIDSTFNVGTTICIEMNSIKN